MTGFNVAGVGRSYRLTLGPAGPEQGVIEIGSPSAELLVDLAANGDLDTKVTPENVDRVYRVLRDFGRALRSWNLTDGDTEVPCTVEGFLTLPLPLCVAMVVAWLEAAHANPSTAPDVTGRRVDTAAATEALLALPVTPLG